MVRELVKTTVDDVCIPPRRKGFRGLVESIISEWKITEQAPDYVKIGFEGNTPENQKTITLSSEGTKIECINRHRGNMQNLRELTDALLKLAAYSQENVRERLKKRHVVTQLFYDDYPSRLRDLDVACMLGDFIYSGLESTVVPSGGLVYTFSKGKNRFSVAFTRPLEKVESKYSRTSDEYIFEEPKRDIWYIS